MLDNIDIAILTKVNELADRFGIKPYEFTATLRHDLEVNGRGLKFIIPGETSDLRSLPVKKMFATLQVDASGLLKGGEIALINALDQALEQAPKQRSRL
jgi:hypothetical protein